MLKSFNDIFVTAKETGPVTLAVACAQDEDVLLAVNEAVQMNLVKAVLVGNQNKIETIGRRIGMAFDRMEIINIEEEVEATQEAVKLVSSGRAHIIMKGLIDTSVVLKAVLNKEWGLRTGKVLSHVAVLELAHYHKLLLLSDAAMNIEPDLSTKKEIIENVVELAHSMGLNEPKVGVVCAKEKVNSKMQSTVDAADLVAMNRQSLIKGCIIGGPFGFDNAVSKKSAEIKGIKDPIAGDIDILLPHNLEAGNIIYKGLTQFSEVKAGGLIVGAKAPVVLTSRADDKETKLNAIALGALMAVRKQQL